MFYHLVIQHSHGKWPIFRWFTYVYIGLPTKNGPCSSIFHGYVSQNQMVSGWMENTSSIDPKSHRNPRNWAPRTCRRRRRYLAEWPPPWWPQRVASGPKWSEGTKQEKHGSKQVDFNGQNRWTSPGGLQLPHFLWDLRIRDDLPMTFIFEVRDSKKPALLHLFTVKYEVVQRTH